MKNRGVKLLFLSAAGVLLLVFAWLSIFGINQAVDKTVNAKVYEEDDWSYIPSSIDISGNLRKTLFSTNFVGTFAIAYYEPSCRDGTEAKIDWQGNDSQTISFFYGGDFSRLDVQMIEIDKEMDRLMIVLKDGTIITSPDYYIPANIWKTYKT